MRQIDIVRKELDNQEFIRLRQNTELISAYLIKRLNEHLKVLRPLFIPKKILGSYLKTSSMAEVPGSDVAFAELKNDFESIAGPVFGISERLKSPLPSMDNHLAAVPYQYYLINDDSKEKSTKIISPVKWVISYKTECSVDTLMAIKIGKDTRQSSFIKDSLVAHLLLTVFMRKFTELRKLITDLRYEVEIEKNDDLGGLPVVVMTTPIKTFLPTDDYINQVTQLSGVPVFHEIINPESIETLNDPFQEVIIGL